MLTLAFEGLQVEGLGKLAADIRLQAQLRILFGSQLANDVTDHGPPQDPHEGGRQSDEQGQARKQRPTRGIAWVETPQLADEVQP